MLPDVDEREALAEEAAGRFATLPLTDDDLQALAERVYALIREELRVERERLGQLRRRIG